MRGSPRFAEMVINAPKSLSIAAALHTEVSDALDDSVEAYHWSKAGGSHIPVPNGEEMQLSIPWFRWKLLGDNEGCKAFKAIRETDSTWEEAAVQNEAPCL